MRYIGLDPVASDRNVLRWFGLALQRDFRHTRANEQYWREEAAARLRIIEETQHDRDCLREQIKELERANTKLELARCTRNTEIERVNYDRDCLRKQSKERLQRIRELQKENACLRDLIEDARSYLNGSSEHAEDHTNLR